MNNQTPSDQALAADAIEQGGVVAGIKPVAERQATIVVMDNGSLVSASLGDDGGAKILINKMRGGKVYIRMEPPR